MGFLIVAGMLHLGLIVGAMVGSDRRPGLDSSRARHRLRVRPAAHAVGEHRNAAPRRRCISSRPNRCAGCPASSRRTSDSCRSSQRPSTATQARAQRRRRRRQSSAPHPARASGLQHPTTPRSITTDDATRQRALHVARTAAPPDPMRSKTRGARSNAGSPKATCRSRSACSCCSPASPHC